MNIRIKIEDIKYITRFSYIIFKNLKEKIIKKRYNPTILFILYHMQVKNIQLSEKLDISLKN